MTWYWSIKKKIKFKREGCESNSIQTGYPDDHTHIAILLYAKKLFRAYVHLKLTKSCEGNLVNLQVN